MAVKFIYLRCIKRIDIRETKQGPHLNIHVVFKLSKAQAASYSENTYSSGMIVFIFIVGLRKYLHQK